MVVISPSEPKHIFSYYAGENKYIIGNSPSMRELFKYLDLLKDRHTTVLLTGETGTGKELCARALHYNSAKRKSANFVAINCTAIPADLLESELFGHEKGAYTGAHRQTTGKFQYAKGGTIFLDEIGEMPLPMQAKLLRAIQEKKITPIGSLKEEEVDVRIVAATNKNLEEAVKKNTFREDLFHRLSVFPLRVPSLRERKEDIPLIVDYLIEKNNKDYQAKISYISNTAIEALSQHKWEGNIRELENIIERTFVLKSEGIIEEEDLHFEKVLEQNTEARKKIPIKESRYWFTDGVLPISPYRLATIAGAYSDNGICNMLSSPNLYVQRHGIGKTRTTPVMFLTKENVPRFFRIQTPEYHALLDQISSTAFNHIVQKPFQIISMAAMQQNPLFKTHGSTLHRAVQLAQPYRIQVGRAFCIALTPENCEPFAANKEELPQIQKQIIESYEKFLAWKPLTEKNVNTNIELL